jgi:hypothetical protein
METIEPLYSPLSESSEDEDAYVEDSGEEDAYVEDSRKEDSSDGDDSDGDTQVNGKEHIYRSWEKSLLNTPKILFKILRRLSGPLFTQQMLMRLRMVKTML